MNLGHHAAHTLTHYSGYIIFRSTGVTHWASFKQASALERQNRPPPLRKQNRTALHKTICALYLLNAIPVEAISGPAIVHTVQQQIK